MDWKHQFMKELRWVNAIPTETSATHATVTTGGTTPHPEIVPERTNQWSETLRTRKSMRYAEKLEKWKTREPETSES